MNIKLPAPVTALYKAHADMCTHFARTGLTFTLDGKLVGDLGEALAAEAFAIKLCEQRIPGVDGHATDGRTVQIKATGKAKTGPAFTPGEGIAQHLIFLRIDFPAGEASVLYNGPEAPVRRLLNMPLAGTQVVRLASVLEEDKKLTEADRLPRVPKQALEAGFP
ncbi:DUF6998 domain-containing protein [Jiella pelagia]|uniref:DUF6998 domain-containing protein n=1 Tax=Jiella pelagia TaxID=2986949 RepID=A0ABY7C857_9HYPH|nr:hypothetical protein [Jiella pelagia]WAP69965.1 hypothetical protein OH818_07285 [Jiella pelagia]